MTFEVVAKKRIEKKRKNKWNRKREMGKGLVSVVDNDVADNRCFVVREYSVHVRKVFSCFFWDWKGGEGLVTAESCERRDPLLVGP